jgi:hypothetical protein
MKLDIYCFSLHMINRFVVNLQILKVRTLRCVLHLDNFSTLAFVSLSILFILFIRELLCSIPLLVTLCNTSAFTHVFLIGEENE